MSFEMFLASLILTLGVVGTALVYLRGITRRVLEESCESGIGAEFWLRSADVLALAGSLILVLAFGAGTSSHDPLLHLRLTLALALAGVFVTVVIVSSSVWRNAANALAMEKAIKPEPNAATTNAPEAV
jgi:hypothetical protein